jgi:16S rRNA (cytidine1402-2'-O)-methyltransferase
VSPEQDASPLAPDDDSPSEPLALDPSPLPVKRSPLAPGLYLVATPIGNLEDITLRALRVLASVDRIACEDTRQTAKLLNHFGIRTTTVSYHAHNEASRAAELIGPLRAGGRLAVVSDAGTPGIADPGAILALEAIAANVAVFPIPGANAALSALIASGLSTERFAFHGFLPSKEGPRRTALESLRSGISRVPQAPTLGPGFQPPPTTHILYETPHRILAALEDIVAVFGPHHRIALARELTKLHEEFLRGPAAEVLATLQARPAIRGEIVLVLDGHIEPATATSTITLAGEVAILIREGLTEKDALKRVAKSRGLGKSEAYREYQRTR